MCNAGEKGKTKKGKIYGIGIGPGDPELLTIKGLKILKEVDCIFAPRADIKSSSMAADIISEFVPQDKIIRTIFPMVKDEDVLNDFWEESSRQVFEKINNGQDVAFVTIGDPFLFSTFNYLIRNLRLIDDSVHIEVIPGISSISAASALGKISMAESREKIAIIPFPDDLREIKTYLKNFETLVVMKIGNKLKSLCDYLKREGLGKTVFFAKNLGSSEEFTAKNLDEIGEDVSGYLSLMIIRR